MKNTFLLIGTLFFLALACTNDTTSNTDEVVEEHNSAHYEKIFFLDGGEILGLTLGETKDEVKAILPKEGYDDETDDYMSYYWSVEDNEYFLDMYFSQGTLASIDGYVYFYKDVSYHDPEAAKAFYEDLKVDFVEKYGEEVEQVDGNNTYMFWYLEDKEIEIGYDEEEAYWKIYQFSY
ncbi:MAG: hypothetical protein ACPG4Z_00200 [Chitinophagales bacterium]